MHNRFDYVREKITAADFSETPFRHVYIEDLFNKEDFAEIIGASEISLKRQESDDDLFAALYEQGYKIIPFPGCVTNINDYKKWRSGRSTTLHNNTACEGFGVTLRLFGSETPIIRELMEFIGSAEFNQAIADKFSVPFEIMQIDVGIQKYLDGYEISPHPDVRKKAATFMVNINPHIESESFNHHTHYLKLRDSHQYVQTFWEGNGQVERCWVPWDWCETQFQQVKNNSIVLFSPASDTMHGVRASYDHLNTQRTQLYGNLWYPKSSASVSLEWEQLALTDLAIGQRAQPASVRKKIASKLAAPMRKLDKLLSPQRFDVGPRSF